MYIDQNGTIYSGQMRLGDREATAEEIDLWQSARLEASKPQAVTRFQARAALLQAGLLDQVNTMMADPGTPAIAKLAWQDAQEFRRNSPTVLAMAAALGLSDVQLDQLFTTAAGIEA